MKAKVARDQNVSAESLSHAPVAFGHVPLLTPTKSHYSNAKCLVKAALAGDTSSRPRLVVLPGMDGTDLMLQNFRTALSSSNDKERVIGVSYPPHEELSVQGLAEYVQEAYLTTLADDPRGYILVNQSFSGHVGFQLAQSPPRGLLAQAFVNAFASPPGPRLLHGARFLPPAGAFRNQPPPWMVSRIFLGRNATGMSTVQAAGATNAPEIMRHRLQLCLVENAWHVWRNRELLPPDSTLYLRGEDDFILSDEQAGYMQGARPDIPFVRVPNGPHLLLQRCGFESARAVEDFCTHVVAAKAGIVV